MLAFILLGGDVVFKCFFGKADFERAEMAARRNIMRQPVYRAWQFLTAKIGEEDRIGESESVRKAKVLQDAPVYTVGTRIAPKDNKGLLEWATAQFEQAGGKAYHPEIGEVLLDRKSVKNSIAHGMNPFKASAFEAVPAVIEKGVVVARTEHGRTSSFFVSAPVRIEGVETVVTVLVRRDMNKQSMYLHSVQNKEKILNAAVNESAADAGASESHGKLHSGYMESLLRKYLTDKLPDRKGGRVLDPSRDSLMAAVAKLGGIGREEAVREWGVDVKDNFRVGILPVLRENGRSIDAMVEALAEEGYLPTDSYGKADVRDLEERFSDGLKGRDYFSIHYVPREEVKPGAELANPYALTAARLDAASLDGIPQGWSEVLSARGMVAKRGGLHPDIAAELVLDEDGWQVFPTGEDLLRALVEAEPPQEAIENTAYLNLLAQFGEVPTAADFEAAADAAAHNGLRMRILAAEFAALKKETGSVSYLKRAAGLIAREKLETVKVADVRPHVFASAEARAGRQAEKAFSKGDTARAAEFKRRQLVQSAMAREAYRVREEMEKEAVITVEAAGHTFAFIAEEYGDTRRFGQKDYTVSGRSLTAYLGADYGKPGSGTYQNAVYARQIADAQLEFSGFKVIGWHIPDWLVEGGSYAVTGKTPMTVLQELAKAADGFVESDPHLPVVRIKPRWPKVAWQIAEAEPDATVPSSVILQIGGRRTVSERCNGVFVWAEHAKGRAGDVYRQGGSREPRAAALTDTLYTDTDVLTAAGMAALSDTGIHKTETVQMPVSEKYGIPLAQLGQIWQIQEPEGHWQGVITGITLTVESENGAPKITQSAVIDRYMDK